MPLRFHEIYVNVICIHSCIYSCIINSFHPSLSNYFLSFVTGWFTYRLTFWYFQSIVWPDRFCLKIQKPLSSKTIFNSLSSELLYQSSNPSGWKCVNLRMVHVSTKSKYFWGGGTSGRAIELFVHLFLTTLFHDFSEINWFVATNFSHSWCRLSWKWNTRYIWGTGSQWEIFATTRLSWNSHTQIWFTDML